MKIVAILLLVLAVGMIITGCAKTTPMNSQNVADTLEGNDFTEFTTNPDIGTLDDIPVSDSIPQ